MMRIFICPGLQQELYLGIDFWKLFGFRPQVVADLKLNTSPHEPLPDRHDLSYIESSRLRLVIESFPSFEKQGLEKLLYWSIR